MRRRSFLCRVSLIARNYLTAIPPCEALASDPGRAIGQEKLNCGCHRFGSGRIVWHGVAGCSIGGRRHKTVQAALTGQLHGRRTGECFNRALGGRRQRRLVE